MPRLLPSRGGPALSAAHGGPVLEAAAVSPVALRPFLSVANRPLPPPNLVPNGSLDANLAGGVPDRWTAQGAGPGVTVAPEDVITRSGRALRVTVDWTQASLNQVHGAFVDLPALPLDAGHYFECWVYLLDSLESSESVVAKLRNVQDAVDVIGQSTGYPVGQWFPVLSTFRTMAAARTYNVQFGLFRSLGQPAAGQTTAIFDACLVQPFQFRERYGWRWHAKPSGGVSPSNVRGPSPGQPGRLPGEYAALFNGAQQMALAPQPFPFARQGFEHVPFTLEVWRYETANPTGGDTVLMGVVGFNNGICATPSTPRWQARFATVGLGSPTISAPLVLNTWTRLVMTYGGDSPKPGDQPRTFRFYMGTDTLVGSNVVNPAAQFGAVSGSVAFGNDGNSARLAFGRQGPSRLYNRELSPEEVAWTGEKWAAGRHPGRYLPGDTRPSCVAEWSFGDVPT